MNATPFELTSTPVPESPPYRRNTRIVAPSFTRTEGPQRVLSSAVQAGMRRAGLIAGGYRPEDDPNSPIYKGRRMGMQFATGEDATPIGQALICAACDSLMTTHQLERTVFQTCCDHCGTSGPRRFTAKMAVDACKKLFKEVVIPLPPAPLTPESHVDETNHDGSAGRDTPAVRQVAEETV